MPVQVTSSPPGRVAVVALIGEHDIANAHELQRTLAELSSNISLVVLDFDAADFIDATILGVIVSGFKRAAGHGTQMIGVNARGIVLKALQITDLDRLLEIRGSTSAIDAELVDLLRAEAADDG